MLYILYYMYNIYLYIYLSMYCVKLIEIHCLYTSRNRARWNGWCILYFIADRAHCALRFDGWMTKAQNKNT